MKWFILLAIIFNAGAVQAQSFAELELRAILHIEPEYEAEASGLLKSAMNLVMPMATPGISWGLGNLQNYNMIIEITNSKKAAAVANDTVAQFTQLDGDAYSVFFGEAPNSPVVVRVLWDRAVLNRPDAFTRLAVLLGHEIYGNVVRFHRNRELLSTPEMQHSEKKRAAFQMYSEVNAFEQGVLFIQKVQNAIGDELPEKMREDFKQALLREEAGLAFYEAKVAEMQDCSRVLRLRRE